MDTNEIVKETTLEPGSSCGSDGFLLEKLWQPETQPPSAIKNELDASVSPGFGTS